MTATYHTPIVDGQMGNEDTFNGPLGELDAAIAQVVAGLLTIANLTITGDITLGDDLTVGDHLQVAGTSTLTGAVAMGGSATVGDDLTVTDLVTAARATLAGLLTVGGNATVAGTLASTGALSTADIMTATKGIVIGSSASTTLASDSFAVTNSYHILDTEAAAATDTLSTITGGVAGRILIIRPSNAARVITITNGSGANNIQLANNTDLVLNDPNRPLILYFNGTFWQQIASNDNQMIVANAEVSAGLVSDAFTATRTSMMIDTEGLAGTDNLVTINGGRVGQLLFLRSTNAARVITVKHNTGANQIFTHRQADWNLGGPNVIAAFVFNGTVWMEIAGDPGSILVKSSEGSYAGTGSLIFPRGSVLAGSTATEKQIRLMPNPGLRDFIYWRPDAAVMLGVSTANLTTSASSTASAINSTDSRYVNYLHTATTINLGNGTVSLFTLLQRQWNPYTLWNIRIGPNAADITNVRLFTGLTSATLTNVDTPTGSSALFRFSTNAADVNWMAMTTNAGTPTVTDTGILVVIDTPYALEIQQEATEVRFYINGTLVATHTTNLPPLTTSLGYQLIQYNLIALQKNVRQGRVFIALD